MTFKPGDFYLGVVDFLGVLVPGAVLVLLQGGRLASALRHPGSTPESTLFVPSTPTKWTILIGTGFIAGQLLLALSELLNRQALRFLHRIDAIVPGPAGYVPELEKRAARLLGAGTVGVTGPTVFHAAISYLRLEAPEAVGEVDRHMADYKLLRNLVAVFLADFLMSLALGPREPVRLIADAVLGVLSFLAFARMFGWAQVLAFQYCCLVDRRKKEPRAP
jgi:hypothetical protein